MKFTVVTILPELIEPALTAGVVGRAREAGTISVVSINPRDFTSDRHRTVDDTPYGGGPGMVMKPEPLLAAIAAAGARAEAGAGIATSGEASGAGGSLVEATPAAAASVPLEASTAPMAAGDAVAAGAPAAASPAPVEATPAPAEASPAPAEPAPPPPAAPHRILLTPAGAPLTQAKVRELATRGHLVLVCGRYEGIDERVIETAIDEELSIGDYVLSGGELAALVVIDAVARLVPGVLGDATSADEESHSSGMLEYPQYTRPLKLGAREVPAILTSGNHAAIADWRRRQSFERTARRRPDLFARFAPSKRDRKLLPPPLSSRTHLALVHHPVVDRTGKLVTTSLTNFDIHDLARSTRTYGLAAYHIVTPVTSQREKAAHIASLWLEENPSRQPPVSGSRAGALALVRTAASVEDVISDLTTEHGRAPLVVATSARSESFPRAARRTPSELLAELGIDDPRAPIPLLLLLGTGWGLADSLIPYVSRLLAPIEGASDWNHLSVRSAGAILLDRLFGRFPETSAGRST